MGLNRGERMKKANARNRLTSTSKKDQSVLTGLMIILPGSYSARS